MILIGLSWDFDMISYDFDRISYDFDRMLIGISLELDMVFHMIIIGFAYDVHKTCHRTFHMTFLMTFLMTSI